MVFSSFPIGFGIEVRSNEDGFKGAWFEAKVVNYIPKSRKYTVSFSNLVSEDSPSKPLEDSVYYTFVRPRPPALSGVKARFTKYDLVEALHNDGWWRGVVSRAPRGKGTVYKVCFPSTREEFEYRIEDMREQLEWVKGEWVLVQDMEGDNVFDVGSRVEVSREKKNHGEVWYVGTVLKIIGKNNLLVEYESVYNSKKMPLKEIVDLQYVRPIPPPSLKFDNSIDVLEEVEACHNGGWVAGVVSKILPGLRYIIKWKHLEEEIELDQTVLRPCYSWTNDSWVRIYKDKSSKRKSIAVKGPTFPILALPSSMNDGDVTVKKSEGPSSEGVIQTSQPCKKLKKEITLEDHLKLRERTKSVGHRCRSGRIKPLINRRKRQFLIGRQSRLGTEVQNSNNNNDEGANGFGIVNCSITPRMVGKVSSVGSLSKGSRTLLTGQHNSSSSQLIMGTKAAEICYELDISRVHGHDSINGAEGSCFLGDASEHLSKTANVGYPLVGHEAADFLPTADLGNYKACRGLTKKTEMQKLSLDQIRHTCDVAVVKPNVEERSKNKGGRARKKKRTYINVNVKQCPEEVGKKKVGRPPKKKITCMNGSEEEHAQEERKKHRGRPKKIRFINGTESKQLEEESVPRRQFVEPTNQTLDVDVSDNGRQRKNCLLAINAEGNTAANNVTDACTCNMQDDIMEDIPVTCEVDSFAQDLRSPIYSDIQQSPVLKCDNRRIAETEAEACTDVLKNVVEMDNTTIYPTTVACDHNEKAFGEIEDRAPIDPSPSGSSLSREDNFPNHNYTQNGSLSEKTVVESKKAPSDQDELRQSTLAAQERISIDPMHVGSLSNEMALPFIKESTMWVVVESMEALHSVPQQPHFRPLEQYEVEFREGMAIGLMVTFANLVASIQKLRITDRQDIFEEKLKALVPLELNGFDIQPVRSRLEKLIEIRKSAGQSGSKKVHLKERIVEREEDKYELDMLVSAHDKIILELEENLEHCRKKRASMVCGSNEKHSEIVQLKIDLQATEEAFFSAEGRFNAAADAPW